MRWLLILFLFIAQLSMAQVSGNEWINTGQPYYKIPITTVGLYRLTADHLRRAGIDPASIDPRTMQLYHRGKEQAVMVSGEDDGKFDDADALVFAGQANDGVPDSALYRPATVQPHPFYSLYSDTTYYFMTWRSGVRGLRRQLPLANTITESRVVLTSDYPAGVIYPLGAPLSSGSVLSHYDEGEGWTGPSMSAGKTFSVIVPMVKALLIDSVPVRLEGWVVGRSAGPHSVRWLVNGQRVGETVFEQYATGRFSVSLPTAVVGQPKALTVAIEPQNEGEQVSLSAVRLLYTQLPGAETSINPAPELAPVRFRTFDPTRANYLIVTHPALRQAVGDVRDPVREYAAYRASPAGGSYDTLTVNVGELFDQFNYGERSPLAIRRFARFMLQGNPQRPPMLFLIGQSRDPQGVRKAANAALLDLVPNAGWPGSDVLLVEGLNGEPRDVPALPVGRLNTGRSQTVLDYLAKVREYEADSSTVGWRKRLLYLSGGRSADELTRFRTFVGEFASVARRPPLGALVETRSKQTTEPVEPIPIADVVNQGVGMITVFGHAGLDVTDVDIGFATDERLGYQNKGRYPFLLVNGCAAGNVFFGRPTFGTDWVTAPNRGAIGFMAHTYNGFADEMKAYSNTFYNTLNDSRWQTEPIGRVQQETIRRYLSLNQTVIDRANAQQFLLQGDPAVRLFPFDKPDYTFGPPNQLLQVPRSDSLIVRVGITNAGQATGGQLPVRVRQYAPDGRLLDEQIVTVPAPAVSDTVTFRIPRRTVENALIELTINPARELSELDYANNTVIVGGNGLTELPFPVDNVPPLLEVAVDGRQIEDDAVVAPQPVITLRIRDDNPRLMRQDTTGILLYLQRPSQAQTGQFERVWLRGSRTTSEENGLAFRVDFRPGQPWSAGRYQLEAYASDLSGNRAAPYRIHFQVVNETGILAAGVGPNPFSRQTRFFYTLTGATPPERIHILIFDLTGRLVRTVSLPGRIGTSEWLWDGTDANGNALPVGLYVYTLRLIGANADEFLQHSAVSLTGRVLLQR